MGRVRKPDDDQGAMDSLLDTMTNVVGILVIVLVVTQLGVGDAVQRIGETLQIDPAELEQKKTEVVNLQDQQQVLKQDLQALQTSDEQELTAQIQRLQVDLDKNVLDLKNLRQKNRQTEDAMAKQKKEAEQEAKKRQELEEHIRSSLAEVSSLRARLDETPERVVLPAKELRLPNPRPAPQGLVPVSLICTKQRVYPLAPLVFGELQKAARSRADSLVRTRRKDLYKEPGKGIDPDEFVKAFSRSPLRNEYYDVQMRAGGDGYPKLTLNPRENAGIREKLLENKSSKFQKDLRSIDPKKYYIRFFVTSDSYETYLIARSIAKSYGFSAGWLPQPAEWKYTGNMGGEIRLGPPRPAPPANPQPAKPPPKKNVID